MGVLGTMGETAPLRGHLIKILTGSSISTIATSETSHKRPPLLSLTSRVIAYGRFHCIPVNKSWADENWNITVLKSYSYLVLVLQNNKNSDKRKSLCYDFFLPVPGKIQRTHSFSSTIVAHNKCEWFLELDDAGICVRIASDATDLHLLYRRHLQGSWLTFRSLTQLVSKSTLNCRQF